MSRSECHREDSWGKAEPSRMLQASSGDIPGPGMAGVIVKDLLCPEHPHDVSGTEPHLCPFPIESFPVKY